MKKYNNFDLTEYNSYKVKAFCRTAYFPETDDDIVELFSQGGEEKVVLGGGFNVLLTKDFYDKPFVIFSSTYNEISLVGENMILCEAGCDMKDVSVFAMENDLSGLEIFYDIPSSLGGAVVMNAGAGGEDIKGVLEKVWYFDPGTREICEISNDEIAFEYRNSFFQKNPQMVICKALLRLVKKNSAVIRSRMEQIKEQRWAKQPRQYPNAGSVFKRPVGRFVGPMIEELGLKGFTVGGAQVSEKHGGFIINFNNATGADILTLINYVRDRVSEKFGVSLEIEQRIL